MKERSKQPVDLVEIGGVWQVPPHAKPTIWDVIHKLLNSVSILLAFAFVGWLIAWGIG